MGLNPITYQDLWCYFSLNQIQPQDWELQLLRKFDIEFLNNYAREMKAQEKIKK